MNNAQQFLTVKEAAALLRITPKQVRRRILDGDIRAIKPPGAKAWLIPAVRLQVALNQGAQ